MKNLQIADKLGKIDTSTVGGRIKYYRILGKISVARLSELTDYSRDNIFCYEEDKNYCPPDFCKAAAKALEIDLDLICDEYTLFLDSGYAEKINQMMEAENLSYWDVAKKYGIPHNTLLGWASGKYAPSRASFEKYIRDTPLFYPCCD